MARVNVLIEYLDAKDRAVFEKVHIHDQGLIYGADGRTLEGWYCRGNLRVAFYYVPSWISRQRMYWLHGWTWEPKKE